MNNSVVLRAIDAAYETIGYANKWPDALQLIAGCLSAKGAILCVAGSFDGYRHYSSPTLTAPVQEYVCRWIPQDIATQRAAMPCGSPSRVHAELHATTPEGIPTHPDFVAFSRKHELGCILRGELVHTQRVTGILTVRKPLGTPPFTAEEVDIFHGIKRHCERVLELGAANQRQHLLAAGLAQFGEAMGFSHVLLDAKGRLLPGSEFSTGWTNEVVWVTSGRVELADHHARDMLRRAIAAALECAATGRDLAPKSVLIPRPDGGRPLIAYVSPYTFHGTEPRPASLQQAAVTITILDLATGSEIDPHILGSLGLTASEARIAALIGTGCSPRETANRLAIAESTVRTTLKLIYAKTGTSRQSEIAVLLGRLAVMSIRLAKS